MEASIKRDHGLLKVDIDGNLFAPLAFKSFRPNPKNVSEFYAAGVRLFTVLSSGIISALGVPYSLYGESWIGEKKYDFSAIDRQMDMFIENAPDGYFAPMFQVDTRPWYLEAHPEVPNSFHHISQIAYDEAWKKAAADYLKAAIRHCEEKYGDRIYGYFLLGGTTTEWLAHVDKEASHPIKEAGYRKYMGDENAALPSFEELEREGRVFLDKEEENVYYARRFHADTVAELLLFFAAEAQSVVQHKKLLGCYFGYLLHLYGSFLFNAGHLAYEKVFLSPDIDMISSPSCYHFRAIDSPSAFMVTQRTLDKHGKLYFLEFDHITHVAPTMIDEPSSDASGNGILKEIPGSKSKCKDEKESLNLMWRDFVLCYGSGAALWWFDMFDGWFRSEGMMSAVSHMICLHERLANVEKGSIAEIAVFAEGEALYHVRKNARINIDSFVGMHRTLAETGAPFDLYSMADIEDLPADRYKLLVMLDAYDISEERMARIRALQENGVTVLWLYAPDYAHKRSCLAENVSRATGLTVTESETSHGDLLYGGTKTCYTHAAPYFAIKKEGASSYAFFEDGAVAVAKADRGRSVYAAETLIPSSLLRQIAEECGCFLYSRNPRVYTYANSGAIGVYNATDGTAEVFVKENGIYKDVITDEYFTAEEGRLLLPLRDMRAYLLIKQ